MSTWLALFLLGTPAMAQEEGCPGPLPLAYWSEAMDAVDDAIVSFNGERANRILDDIHHELRCLDRPAPPAQVGRLARQLSLMAFYEQDAAETEAWAILARDTIGGAPWPATVPVPPAYHRFVAALPETELTPVDGRGLVPPKKGAILLDGWLLAQPEATLGTTHLLQVADKKGLVLSTDWQHGISFPSELLGDPGVAKAPKWYAPPAEPLPMPAAPVDDTDAVVAVDPPEDAVEVPAVDDLPTPPADAVPDETPPDVVPPDAVVDAVVDPAVDDATRVARRIALPAEEREKMFGSKDLQDGCPWKREPNKASATGGSVTINKRTYSVRSAVDQAKFRSVLRSCGELRAARRFDRWRDAKKSLAFDARTYRDRMVKALLTEEPERKRKAKAGPAGEE